MVFYNGIKNCKLEGLLMLPRRSTNYLVFLVCIITGILLCFSSLVLAATISGRVSLPAGDAIPTGGMRVNVYIRAVTGTGYGYGNGGSGPSSIAQVDITPSDPAPTYTFSSVPDDAGLQFEVSYGYYVDTSIITYLFHGYFKNSSQTTWRQDQTTLLQGGENHNNVDLILIRAKIINGQLSLPVGDTASEDICFGIETKSNLGNMHDWAHIDKGEDYFDYSIKIPDDSSISWKVSYNNLKSCSLFFPTDFTYWGVGYYKSTAPGTTVLHETDADSLPGGQDHTDINMTVFEGKTVTGSISLPDNKNATHDMKFFIRAEVSGSSNHDQMKEGFGYGYGTPMTYDEYSVYNTITIRQGQSTSTYTLTISPESNITWNVFYSCLEGCNSNYDSPGYYNTSATTSSLTNASPLAGGVDHSSINLTLLKQKGMLSFPVRSKDGQISIISM
jgi:hypothetical protein